MSMHKPVTNTHLLWSSLIISISLVGCASTTTTESGQDDPWHGWNRGTQSFNDGVDRMVLKPLAKGYQWVTTDTIDQGVSNFFSNINDIGVTINDFLQFKVAQGGMDAGRFLINTTAGVGGLVDVAGMIDLPKHNEDFGQTLGFWGIPSGPYLVLPFFGPSSPRETVGRIGDALMNPLTYVSVFGGGAGSVVSAGSRAVDVTDSRADSMTTEKIVDEASVDRYDFIKNAYQQRREYLLHDGNVPEEEDDLSLEEDSISEDNNASINADDASSAGNNAAGEPSSKTDGSTLSPDINNSKPFLDLSAPEDQ